MQHLCVSRLNSLNLNVQYQVPNIIYEKFSYIKRFDEIKQSNLHSELIGWVHALDESFELKFISAHRVIPCRNYQSL